MITFYYNTAPNPAKVALMLEETQLLGRARTIALSSPEAARALLQRYDARFPRGELRRERDKRRVSGLTPGEHGFHVHEVGDCSAADATSAKGHFNPAGKPHGHHGGAERHAGDMPNLVADASGTANLAAELSQLTLGNDANGIAGRSVVIHADPDDFKSQPAGNSGKRVACGVVRLTAPRY